MNNYEQQKESPQRFITESYKDGNKIIDFIDANGWEEAKKIAEKTNTSIIGTVIIPI